MATYEETKAILDGEATNVRKDTVGEQEENKKLYDTAVLYDDCLVFLDPVESRSARCEKGIQLQNAERLLLWQMYQSEVLNKSGKIQASTTKVAQYGDGYDIWLLKDYTMGIGKSDVIAKELHEIFAGKSSQHRIHKVCIAPVDPKNRFFQKLIEFTPKMNTFAVV